MPVSTGHIQLPGRLNEEKDATTRASMSQCGCSNTSRWISKRRVRPRKTNSSRPSKRQEDSTLSVFDEGRSLTSDRLY